MFNYFDGGLTTHPICIYTKLFRRIEELSSCENIGSSSSIRSDMKNNNLLVFSANMSDKRYCLIPSYLLNWNVCMNTCICHIFYMNYINIKLIGLHNEFLGYRMFFANHPMKFSIVLYEG